MTRLSQTKRIVHILKSRPMEKLKARQLAELLVATFPEDYAEKRRNTRFETDKDFIQQIAAEIGSHKNSIAKADPHVHWQDRPKPRVYWYDPERLAREPAAKAVESATPEPLPITPEDDEGCDDGFTERSEHDLYPLLVDYLKDEHDLFCQRIDERRSRNTNGAGGNHWLHPDIVAMHAVARSWDPVIKDCIKAGASQSVRLLSYEVKKHLTLGNVRKCFFQAVSNSSWANEGYLVATSMATGVEQELRVLNALHGIGVIILDPDNPSESDLMLPARAKPEVDWQSVNRILKENDDFKDFVDKVSIYYQTGNVRAREWNNL